LSTNILLNIFLFPAASTLGNIHKTCLSPTDRSTSQLLQHDRLL